jgi:hypothetical protein
VNKVTTDQLATLLHISQRHCYRISEQRYCRTYQQSFGLPEAKLLLDVLAIFWSARSKAVTGCISNLSVCQKQSCQKLGAIIKICLLPSKLSKIFTYC